MSGGALVPAAAPAETVQSVVVRARVFYGFNAKRTSTRFTSMGVYNAKPRTRVTVACRPGGGRTSCGVSAADLAVPRAGLLDFSRFVRGRLRPGDALDVTMVEAEGRRKLITMTARPLAVPQRQQHCFGSDGSEIACTVGCVVGTIVPPGDPCEDAGVRIRIKRWRPSRPHGLRYDWFTRWTKKTTRFTTLRLQGLLEGMNVVLICLPGPASTCPFGARLLTPRRGRIEIAHAIRRMRFLPGVRLDLKLVKTNMTSEVLRFTIRHKRKPRLEKLCQAPADPEPHEC
jgi:hypothetical protein